MDKEKAKKESVLDVLTVLRTCRAEHASTTYRPDKYYRHWEDFINVPRIQTS